MLTGSKDLIQCIRYDDNDQYLFVAQKNRLSLYNVNGNEVMEYNTQTNSNVNTIEVTPNSIISGSNHILVHDKLTELPIRRYEGMKKVNEVKYSNDLVFSCDLSLKIWDLKQSNKYKPVQEFEESKDYLNSLDYYDLNGFIITCGSNDGKLYSYDLRMGLLNINEFHNPITKINYNKASGDLLLNVLNRGTILYNQDKDQIIKEIEIPNSEYKLDNCFYKDTFIATSTNGILYLPNKTIKTESNQILTSITSINNKIAVSTSDGSILYIDTIMT